MDSAYWKATFIQPANPNDSRCVMLYGELDEVVGPLSSEQAEAWIATFDNRQREMPGRSLGREPNTLSSVHVNDQN